MSVQAWLWNLAAYSAQIAALVGAGALSAAASRVGRPRVMLGYWRALLCAALLLPLVQPWRPPALSPAAVEAAPAALDEAVPGLSSRWPQAVAVMLAAGIALRLVWLCAGLWRLSRYRRRARPVALEDASALQQPLGVAPALYVSDEVEVPVTFGARRPAILLPPRVLVMDRERRRAIVCHEMLHVRRHDWLCTVLEECVRCVLWFHPAVAWLLGRLRLSREQLVDREVVRITGRRSAYLEALIEVAEAGVREPLTAPSFFKQSQLKHRIEMLLEEVSMSTRRMITLIGLNLGVTCIVSVLAVRALPLVGPDAAERSVAVEEGVARGVRGGVEGGVPGGVAGGIPEEQEPGAADEKDKAKAKRAAGGRKILHKVNPVFPERFKKTRLEPADVVLSIMIDKSGEVSDVKVLKGHASFNDNAVTAVRQWRFEPSEESPAQATITIRFVPPPPPPPPPPPKPER
jgi:TonB family protein